MAVPYNYRPLSSRLARFASKIPAEAESPYVPHTIAGVQMIGNHSVTPGDHYLKPPSDLIYGIKLVLILIRDNTPMSAEDYISSGPLTNGINFEVRNNGTIAIANTLPIKSISDFGSYAGIQVQPFDYVNNPNSFAVCWCLDGGGSPLFLSGEKDESIHIILTDNFTSLTGHTALFQGEIFSTDVNKR